MSTRKRLQVLRALFAEAHLAGMQALAAADYDAFAEAVRIERELVQEHVALLNTAWTSVRDAGSGAATSPTPLAAAAPAVPAGTQLHSDELDAFRIRAQALLARAACLEWSFTRPTMQQRAAIVQQFIAGRLRAIADLNEDLRSWDLTELLRGYTQTVEELERVHELHGPDAELRDASSRGQKGGPQHDRRERRATRQAVAQGRKVTRG